MTDLTILANVLKIISLLWARFGTGNKGSFGLTSGDAFKKKDHFTLIATNKTIT